MRLEDIKNPVSSLVGVGPTTVKCFAALNIFTIADLLLFFPRDYKDRTKRIPLSQYSLAKEINTIATVVGHEWFGYGKMRTLKIIVRDNSATACLIAFNRPFLEKTLPVGSIILLCGSFNVKYNSLQSTSFEAEKIADSGSLSDYDGVHLAQDAVIPIYPLTRGLTQKKIYRAMKSAQKEYLHGIDEDFSSSVRESRSLLSKKESIQKIHFPSSLSDVQKARHTLIYTEFFFLQKTIAQRSFAHRGSIPNIELESAYLDTQPTSLENNEIIKNDFSPKQNALLKLLPFELTRDQLFVINQMNLDIDRAYKERSALLKLDSSNNKNNALFDNTTRPPFTMQRLLQGDVGSGKTLVALFACLRIIDWGGQCAFMAPTEILAKQHAENTENLLGSLGVRTAFLSGNIKTKGRAILLKELKEGHIDILIGTHALFSNATIYNDLRLAIIDEQHRFGVLQRQAIIEKGRSIVCEVSTKTNEISVPLTRTVYAAPNLLMMSATPIPQTMALTVFGDLDVSVIHTMPCGRKPVETHLTQEGHEINVYNAVRRELQNGHQAYFVYPAINSSDDESEDAALMSAQKAFDVLSNKIFPEYKCALLHSKVPEDEQTQILRDFRGGTINILAATTVVEVGVDVPNATCITIQMADMFGLSQLHQLRGRVGRGEAQSYCFLVYRKNLTETGKARMKIIQQNNDGFVIAESDLKLRGPGELTGTIQAGTLELGIADIERDKKILLQARADAFSAVQAEIASRSF